MWGRQSAWVLGVLVLACGGSGTPEAKEASPLDEERAFMNQPEGERANDGPTRADLREQEEEKKRRDDKQEAAARPEFKENSSVDDAIKAIPPGAERLNLDQEDLAEPLKDPAVYEVCKPRPADRVKIRVAVWDGKAVGVDVDTTPKNPKLADCVNQQIRALTWKARVPSLNTIEFSF